MWSITRPGNTFAAAILAASVSLWSCSAKAAELVMFTLDGCPWCARFEREVGPVYPKTAEGRRAPLRRVDVRSADARMAGLKDRVVAAPTFVLMHDNQEIGRINGYAGDDAFWGLLGQMLAGLDDLSHSSAGQTAVKE